MKNKFTLLTFITFISLSSFLFKTSIGQIDHPCMVFPAAGLDVSQSLGVVEIEIIPFGTEEIIHVTGPTQIQRSDPLEINGERIIETEIVQMNLTGTGNILEFVQIQLNPAIPSVGRITDRNPDPNIDFPAESFFDVFIEVFAETPLGGLLLHNEDPLRISTFIDCIEPFGESYEHEDEVVLYDPAGIPLAIIKRAAHKLEQPLFSVEPAGNLDISFLGPFEFPVRTFPGAGIVQPNLPISGYPPIGRIDPPMLGLIAVGDNLNALSFGFDELNPEPINYAVLSFSVDTGSIGIPFTAVELEFLSGTSYGPPHDVPAPPEQIADIFYTPLNATNFLIYDEKDPNCFNFNMTVTNLIPTTSNCTPGGDPPPGWPGGAFPEDTDALEISNIFSIGMDQDMNNLIDTIIAPVFFSIEIFSTSFGFPALDFRPGPPDGVTSPDDILVTPSPGGFYGIFASGVIDIGLMIDDDIDALCLQDKGTIGFLDPGLDEALFSLTPFSPILPIIGGSPADIFYTDFTGTFSLYSPAIGLGLLVSDNVDALDCQCLIDTTIMYDYGDAPDPTYPTLLVNFGARHKIDTLVFLGTLIDGEADGQPNSDATGDNIVDLDDEDGVVFLTGHQTGTKDTLIVTASVSGFLNAWCDFNVDGDWADAGEQVFMDKPLVAGANQLTFDVPATSLSDTSFIRFRFNTLGGLSYTGSALDGEVEDYEYFINEHIDIPNDTLVSSVDTCFSAIKTITIPESNGSYVVKDGASLELVAGEKVTVKPFFKSEVGSYTHIYIGEPSCPVVLAPSIVTTIEDQDMPLEDDNIQVYPNPTTGITNIIVMSENKEDLIHIQLFSLVGTQIINRTIPYQEDFQFDMSQYNRGIYIIKIMYNNELYVKKLIKQ